jgi:hypothetical protein
VEGQVDEELPRKDGKTDERKLVECRRVWMEKREGCAHRMQNWRNSG